MNNPWTLDASESFGIEFATPNSNVHASQLRLPMGSSKVTARAAQIIPWANDRADLKAPGVRDQMQDPTRVYLGPFRSSVYDVQRTNNNAPIPGWDAGFWSNGKSVTSQFGGSAQAMGNGCPTWMHSEANIKRGAHIWELLQNTKFELHPAFQERGEFIVPYTGFSAFADIKPRSTVPFI